MTSRLRKPEPTLPVRGTASHGLRGTRAAIESAVWAILVLGGIALFFWLIWDPPI